MIKGYLAVFQCKIVIHIIASLIENVRFPLAFGTQLDSLQYFVRTGKTIDTGCKLGLQYVQNTLHILQVYLSINKKMFCTYNRTVQFQ